MGKEFVLGAVLGLLVPSAAFAWGDVVHKAICEIAFDEMEPGPRGEVIALLQQDNEFTHFRDSCTFADHPRKRPTEHFINLPRNTQGIDPEPCPLADKCVVSAIQDDFAVLASPSASEADKLSALKFLGHWVGDVHQPMHVSFEDDRGANGIGVQGTSFSNLHSAWDTCIAEERIGTDPVAMADAIEANITDQGRADWLESDVVDWADESFTISLAPETDYCVRVGHTCRYEADNVEFDQGETEKMVIIDDAYLDMQAHVVRERIAMAGVRLAGLINRAFAGKPASNTGQKSGLLDRINAIESEIARLRSDVEAIEE